MELVLYFAPGACSRVPMIALEEIGQPFETRLVVFKTGEHKSPEYLALNPAGKVPLLLADGKPIAQNLAIQTFLARSFPAAELLPFTGDPLDDARVLGRIAWFSADLHPLVTRIRLPFLTCDAAPDRVKAQASEAMAAQLRPLDEQLAGQPWVDGHRWSLFDAYLTWVWFRITGAGFDPTPFPNIAAHSARMDQRPAVQRAVARERMAEADLEARGLTMTFPAAGPR